MYSLNDEAPQFRNYSTQSNHRIARIPFNHSVLLYSYIGPWDDGPSGCALLFVFFSVRFWVRYRSRAGRFFWEQDILVSVVLISFSNLSTS